jgi:hypothetical protein
MGIVHDNHVIETLAANGSDQALDVRTLPWTHGAGGDLRDSQAGHAVTVAADKDAVVSKNSTDASVKAGLDEPIFQVWLPVQWRPTDNSLELDVHERVRPAQVRERSAKAKGASSRGAAAAAWCAARRC